MLGIVAISVVGVLSLVAVVLFVGHGDEPGVYPKNSWCSYAAHTEASGLVALAETTNSLDGVQFPASGYLNAAPARVKPAVSRVIAGVKALEGQVPRQASAATHTAAVRVDKFAAAYCK